MVVTGFFVLCVFLATNVEIVAPATIKLGLFFNEQNMFKPMKLDQNLERLVP